MPIHDWSRVPAGAFHDFHQDWIIGLIRTLNRELLPPEYSAITEVREGEWRSNLVANQGSPTSRAKALLVADSPPHAQQVARIESEVAAYARRANRIIIRHEFFGHMVAVLEVVSPGNKDSSHAIRSFTTKAIEFLQNGTNLLIVDLFPPTARDPDGIHDLLWAELTDEPIELRPPDKPLTVVSYDSANVLTAYVNLVAVGDRLPDTPLFIAPGTYINIPLEATYEASWAQTPQLIRDLVEPPMHLPETGISEAGISETGLSEPGIEV